MLKGRILKPALAVVTIASAMALTSLGATAASAATHQAHVTGVTTAATAAQADTATSTCEFIFTLQNDYGYGFYDSSDSTWWLSSGNGSNHLICDKAGAGENNLDQLEDQTTGECLTWNGSSNTIYDASCGRYPASQSWGFIYQSGGTQIKNYYAGKCLAANGTGIKMYTYECAPNGDLAQDWYDIPVE